MTALARFEGYHDDFAVTATALDNAMAMEPSPFEALVMGPTGGPLAGIAVTVTVPWTYTMRPTLILKELYVDEAHRGRGVGAALFAGVKDLAGAIGAGRIDWLVLPANSRAKDFYRRLGGRTDDDWERWTLKLRAPHAPVLPGNLHTDG